MTWPAGQDSAPQSGRFRPPRPRLWADIAVAGALLLLLGLQTAAMGLRGSPLGILEPGTPLTEPFTGLGIDVRRIVIALAGIGMPVAAVWRASRPVASSVTVYALALVHFLIAPMPVPADLVLFLVLYSVTVHGPRWAERAALTGGVLGALLIALIGVYRDGGLSTAVLAFAFGMALVMLAWGAGLLRRSRAAHRESLRERAARLEWERDQQAELATAAERTRIAREMHDIVAHSLSVVTAQADGGRYAAAADPAAAGRALETIAETGRAALTDMRRILGILRSDGDGGDGGDQFAPQPSTDDLEALFANIRDSGVPVSHVQMGTPVGLPPGSSAALYRITQESLTNVLKHGGPDVRVTVLTEWRPDEVRLIVTDDGRGAASTATGGHGLVGMRERAAMLGGSLRAGPGPAGGFRVEARIPVGSVTAVGGS